MKREGKMTREEIGRLVRDAMQDAVDFIESEISPDRIKAQRYFNGETDLEHEEGRSKVVATKVRDHIRAVKPSLMRVFLTAESPVEYTPVSQQSAQLAEQATKYAMMAFRRGGGYSVLNAAFEDALLKKNGIVKAYWDVEKKVDYHEFHDLTQEELTLIVNDPGVEVVEHKETAGEPELGPDGQLPLDENGEPELPFRHYLKVARTEEFGNLKLVPVPPEEFFIDRNARSLSDAYIVAHRTEMRVGDVVAMGFKLEDVIELDGVGGADIQEEEEEARRGYPTDSTDEDAADPSMRLVTLTEAFMRIDVEGNGSPSMYKLVLGGTDYQLLDYEPWGERPFASFCVDPIPHAFFGRSLADILIQEQDVSTSMLRGVIDNVHLTNNPQRGYLDGEVNLDDLMNNEIGALVRMTRPDAVLPLNVEFIAGQTLAAIQYFDQELESKTGVTRASMGLHPDALQSTTKAAVDATVQGAAGQSEVMARNLAEGGMCELFRLILRLLVENANDDDILRLAGEAYEPVDPRSWNIGMDVAVNVGLGTGRHEQKQAALASTLQMQMGLYQQYGPGNGIVTLQHIWHTVADSLALNGINNAARYFTPITAQMEQQIQQAQQAAAAAQPQGDPQSQAFLQAEGAKVQQREASDLREQQMEWRRLEMEDDRKRDEMDMNMLLKAAELLGKFGVQVDTNRIQALQNAPRGQNVQDGVQ